MHIYISILLLLIIAIIVGWFVIGIVFNNLVLSRISDYWRNKHRLGSQVPSWTEPLAFAIAGPIGWGLWLFGWLVATTSKLEMPSTTIRVTVVSVSPATSTVKK